MFGALLCLSQVYFLLLIFLNSSKVKKSCTWSLRISLSHASCSRRLIPRVGAPLSLSDNDSTKLKSHVNIQVASRSWNLQILNEPSSLE